MPGTIDVQIDWDNDGLTTGDSVINRLLASVPIRIVRGRDQIRALAPPAAGAFGCEIWNVSKDYSPENSTGSLYGNLLPGRPVQCLETYGGSTYNLFRGTLDDLPQHPERPKQSVSVVALGTLARLKGQGEQKVSTQLYQNITTNEALNYLLEAVNISTTFRNISTGMTTFAWWWLDNEDAFSAAEAILNSEGPGAALYEDGSGRIVFENRHNRLLTARCITSQTTFRDSGAEPLHTEPFTYQQRWKDVINECQVTHKTRQVESLQKIWELGSTQTVSLSPNESRSYDVKLGSDPFTGAVCSSSGSDFTVSAGSLSSVSFNRTSGASCTITLTAGSGGATVTNLRVRAQPVTVAAETLVKNTISSTDSQSKYGIRTYDLKTRSEIAINTLQDFTNAVVAYYKEPRPIVEITLVGASSTRLEQILTREISDRVTVVEAQTGLNADCFLEKIEHEIQWGGNLHIAKFGLEKASATKYFVLDTSTLGSSSGAGGTDVLGF